MGNTNQEGGRGRKRDLDEAADAIAEDADGDGVVVVVTVGVRLLAGTVDNLTAVGEETGDGLRRISREGRRTERGRRGAHNADVAVNGVETTVGGRLEHLGGDDLLDGEDDAVLAAEGDGRAAEVNQEGDQRQERTPGSKKTQQ